MGAQEVTLVLILTVNYSAFAGRRTHSPVAAQPVDGDQAAEPARIGLLPEHSAGHTEVCAQVQR